MNRAKLSHSGTGAAPEPPAVCPDCSSSRMGPVRCVGKHYAVVECLNCGSRFESTKTESKES